MNLRKKLALAGAGVLMTAGIIIPATMAQAAQSCEVVYTVNSWNNGFTANLTVRNTGDAWIQRRKEVPLGNPPILSDCHAP